MSPGPQPPGSSPAPRPSPTANPSLCVTSPLSISPDAPGDPQALRPASACLLKQRLLRHNPMHKADVQRRLASIRSLLSSASSARERPIVRGIVWVPPAAGSIPRAASGSPKTASSEAIRMSQSIAISIPEPITNPCNAATIGLSSDRNWPQTSRSQRTCLAMTLEGAVPNSVRSAPVQKALSPSPRSRTQRTSGSYRTASSAWLISSRIWML